MGTRASRIAGLAMAVAMAGSVAGANVAAAAGTDSPSASFSSPVANSPSTDPASSTTATDPTGEPTITPEQLAAQIARATELRDQIVSRNGAIKAVLDKLDASTKVANSALEDYSKARNAEDDAKAESARQSEIAKALQDRLDEARDDLGSWAVDAYTQGGSWAESLSFLDALSQEADKSSNPLTDLDFVTDNRIRSVEDLREVTVQQKLASMKSDAAADLAITAAAKAKKSKIAATAAVNAHRDELKTLQQANADVIAEAGPLAGALLGSGDQSAVDAANALSQALETANVDVSSLKLTPCTDKTGVWPNGQIPPSALCPLVGSTDEFLIPAAAAAFNAMSKAYAEETGNLICVTDGYRSYAEQVKIKEIRGPWAATPGTSEHGLGKALDLCGGIQSYSDPAHLWMVRNAPLFGWFHPSWAAQGGTLPEPWHWEFAG